MQIRPHKIIMPSALEMSLLQMLEDLLTHLII